VIVYPRLAAALKGRDLDDVALASGVPTHTIRYILHGEIELDPGIKMRLANALGRKRPGRLFEYEEHVEAIVAAAPSRKITDAEVNRQLDGVE
jgi:plasmid maintenance system antidote protein VapI